MLIPSQNLPRALARRHARLVRICNDPHLHGYEPIDEFDPRCRLCGLNAAPHWGWARRVWARVCAIGGAS